MKSLKKHWENFWKYRDLLFLLVTRDLKLKYRRSVLGYIWTILNPLMIMLIMTLVFSTMFSNRIPNFPVYLMIGRLFYDFLNEANNHAMGAIVGNRAILRKAYLPKYVFVVSSVASSFVNMLFSLGALLIVMIFTRTPVSWNILLFPLTLLQMLVFSMGFGLFLAQANVYFRDMKYIYRAFSLAWMYATPIFYPLESLPSTMQFVVKHFNPMFFYIEQGRNTLLYGNTSSLILWVSGSVSALLFLIVGMLFFYKNQRDFILYV